MGDFIRVAGREEIPTGQGRTFELRGKKIAVFNCDGTFYAIDDGCKHQGGPLGQGELEGTTVTCPWHGWEYDVITGVSLEDPRCSIETYPVKIDGDDVLVAA